MTVDPAHTVSPYTPEYRVNSDRVELRGAVIRGASSIYLTHAVPANIRPKEAMPVSLGYSTAIPLETSKAGLSVGVVSQTGNVHYKVTTDAPAGTWYYLDGISWAIGA